MIEFQMKNVNCYLLNMVIIVVWKYYYCFQKIEENIYVQYLMLQDVF